MGDFHQGGAYATGDARTAHPEDNAATRTAHPEIPSRRPGPPIRRTMTRPSLVGTFCLLPMSRFGIVAFASALFCKRNGMIPGISPPKQQGIHNHASPLHVCECALLRFHRHAAESFRVHTRHRKQRKQPLFVQPLLSAHWG